MPLSANTTTSGGTLVGEIAKVKPHAGESKNDFVSRCISAMADEGVGDNDQRVAMCHGMWEQSMKKRAAEIILQDFAVDDLSEAMGEIDTRVHVFKVSEEDGEMFTEGAVLVPESLDRQGDIVSAEEIRKASYDFMAKSQAVGEMHERLIPSTDAVLVENRILKRSEKIGGNQLPAGSWVVKHQILGDELKQKIREGKLRGYSIGGIAQGEEED